MADSDRHLCGCLGSFFVLYKSMVGYNIYSPHISHQTDIHLIYCIRKKIQRTIYIHWRFFISTDTKQEKKTRRSSLQWHPQNKEYSTLWINWYFYKLQFHYQDICESINIFPPKKQDPINFFPKTASNQRCFQKPRVPDVGSAAFQAGFQAAKAPLSSLIGMIPCFPPRCPNQKSGWRGPR